jgi:cell division protein FtsB
VSKGSGYINTKLGDVCFSGRNVLNQKSELQRAIEKHRENQTKKELEQKKLESRTPLQRVIEERAKRLEMVIFIFIY